MAEMPRPRVPAPGHQTNIHGASAGSTIHLPASPTNLGHVLTAPTPRIPRLCQPKSKAQTRPQVGAPASLWLPKAPRSLRSRAHFPRGGRKTRVSPGAAVLWCCLCTQAWGQNINPDPLQGACRIQAHTARSTPFFRYPVGAIGPQAHWAA